METIQLRGSVELVAAADPNAPKRFTMLAYSGSEMSVGGYGRLVIDGNGVKSGSDPLPILKNHDEEQIVGHGSAKVDKRNGEITVNGVVSGSGEAAREVVANSQNGFVWQASVGAAVSKSEHVEAGAKVRVNGREFVGPLTVVRQSVLREVSFVPIGADAATSASIAAKSPGGLRMNGFDQWLVASGFDANALNDTQRESLAATYAKANPSAVGAPAKRGASASAVKSLLAQFTNEMPNHAEAFTNIAAAGIEAGLDAEDIENKMILFGLRSNSVPSVVQRDGGTRPGQSQVLEAALAMQLGASPKFVAAQYADGQRIVDAATGKDTRGITLHGIMRQVLRAAGMHVPTGRMADAEIREAFIASNRLQASGGPSTISIPGILSNAANKLMLESFTNTGVTWNKFARVSSNSDFKESTRYRMTGVGEFKEIAPGGEIKHVSLDEADTSAQLATYGALLAVDRRDLINDDLGAFAGIPRVLGRMSALKLEKSVYTLLLANADNFFGTGNANYASGAPSALSSTSLAVALGKFRDQVDGNGDPCLLSPSVLLVPPAIESVALALMSSTDVVATTTANAPIPSGNSFKGLAEVVVAPFLSTAAGLTGASNTGWYLTVGPSDFSVIEVATLNGMVMPTIETGSLDFNRLGYATRAYHDFGVSLLEHRGGVLSSGA